jgi:flagellar hook protein FlgE
MMRSLSSAVAGLRTHQTKMDVIGNNIANVNTFGYKTSRATFSDVYYQTIASGRNGADVGANYRGGQNPTQVGYGSQLSTIDVIMSNGGGSYTGRAMDVYIDGDGFLPVEDAEGAVHFTRLGNLSVIDGKLVDYAGNVVMGISDVNPATGISPIVATNGSYVYTDLEQITFEDCDLPVDKSILDCVTSINIGSDGKISGVLKEDVTYDGIPLKANEVIYLAQIAIATFPNQDGLTQTGMSQYNTSASSGDASYTLPATNGAGKVQSGYLEMANVELSQQFTDMITTQRGFQANTRIVTVSDEMLQELVNLKR